MTKASTVRRFVSQNILLLTSAEGTLHVVKRRKQEFIAQHSLKSEDVFTNVQIAQDTLRLLIETKRVTSEEAIRKASVSSPFLERHLHGVDIDSAVASLARFSSNVLSPEDLPRLAQAEFIAAKTQELVDEATKKAHEDLERERARLKDLQVHLDEKMRIANRITSELDGLPEAVDPEKYVVDRPETGDTRAKDRSLLWWERLGLSGDPFPTKKGLYHIPEEKYEEVVVQTDVFKQYLEILSRRPQDIFGKTMLINGQFGSGKTTFLQFISYKTLPHKILPIQVILEPMADSELIRESLYAAINEEVSLALKKRGVADPRAVSLRLDINRVISMLRDLKETSGIKGFLLTINGLHKAESTLDSCLEFLKQLQNFHESMDSHEINMCILIEGSPLWTRAITQNPAFSGSFYRVDQIPNLSPGGAFKLLLNRLKAFESGADIPVFIDRGSVEFAYSQVAHNQGGIVTFRSFIDYILPRLEKGEFDATGISVAIDREAFEKIDAKLKSSSIAQNYDLYRKRTSGRSTVRRSCRAVLEKLYRKGSLEERDELFQQSKGAFWVLDRCDMIQKVRTRPDSFGWGLSKDLLVVLENLNEQGMQPDVIFRCMSMDPDRFPEVDKIQGDSTLTTAQDILARWEAEWPELKTPLNEFIGCHQSYLDRLHGDQTDGLCECCQSAVKSLIIAAETILEDKVPAEKWVEATWVDLSTPETIMSVLLTSSLQGGEKYDYVIRYNESARVLLEVIDDLLKIRRIVDLRGSNLEKADLRGLYSSAVSIEAGDHSRAIDELNSRLEHKIRSTLHLAMAVHLGPGYEAFCPPSARERIEKARAKKSEAEHYEVDSNLLFYFSRGEYSELLKSVELWDAVFKGVFSPHSREEIVTALQKTFSLDTRRAHRDRPGYFRTVAEESRKAIANGKWLLESMDKVVSLILDPPGFLKSGSDLEKIYKISFNGQDHISQSYQWRIPTEEVREIQARIQKRPSPIDVSADSLVAATFGYSPTETLIIASDLKRMGQIEVQYVDGTSHIRFLPHLIEART